MIISSKNLPLNSYRVFFKVIKNPSITKSLCKEILRKYRPVHEKKYSSAHELNFSYTSNMISFSVCDKELAQKILQNLRQKYFTTKMYSKSIQFKGSKIIQYLITAELTHPISFKESFLKKVARSIYEKTGYVPKVSNGLIAINARNSKEIHKIINLVSQGGRVAIRLSGNKKILNDKGETVKVGKVLFSNYHGRPLFDKCIEKDNNVFILLDNQILYELRMMFRLGEIKDNLLHLECDGIVYGSFLLNEKNLMRPEILLASFSDDGSTQHFVKKLKNPLPKLELYHTIIASSKIEGFKLWTFIFLLVIGLFLFLSRKKRKTILFLVLGIFFTSTIFASEVGILHYKILSISLLISLFVSQFKGLGFFICNISLIILCMLLRHFYLEELIYSIFFASTAQLLMYQNLPAFACIFYPKLSS